jgi:hypothetical protein
MLKTSLTSQKFHAKLARGTIVGMAMLLLVPTMIIVAGLVYLKSNWEEDK